MNWEMIGAIGEILGALGVILTLFYLARQIRASNRESQQAAIREIQTQTGSMMDAMMSTPHLAGVWVRGLAGDPDLTFEEQSRFQALAYRMTLLWERIYSMSHDPGIQVPVEDVSKGARQDVLSTPGYQVWFRERAHWFTPDFRAYIQEQMAESAEVSMSSVRAFGSDRGGPPSSSRSTLNERHPSEMEAAEQGN